MTKQLAIVALAVLTGLAQAQSATIRVTADGAASAIVAPGSSVTINATVSWIPGAVGWGPMSGQLAGAKGEIRVQGDVGTGSNFTNDFWSGSQLVQLGSFVGGSRAGIDIAVVPSFFTGGLIVPPSHFNTGIVLGAYTLDLVGVAPGTYDVSWVMPAFVPDIRVYPHSASPNWVNVPTTLIGATITVIPAPASLASFGLAALASGRRRESRRIS